VIEDLSELLARSGLPRNERGLIAAKVAIATADWDRLGACTRAYRALGAERAALEETLLQAVLTSASHAS